MYSSMGKGKDAEEFLLMLGHPFLINKVIRELTA